MRSKVKSPSSERWLVYDVETTGLLIPSAAELTAQPSIIEFAIVEIIDNVIARDAVWLINPGKPLTDEIIKITKLTDADLKDKPAFAAVLAEIVEWFVGAHGLVAHNLPFDLNMLVTELKRLGKEFAFPYPPEQLCTVSAFEHLKGRRMKLTELYQSSIGRELKQTHRALDDARALAEIVIKEGLL
jgi:DNA polymerase III epsilon subunit family exonuclease